jgi:PAS domain S-box-containing protein
MAMNPVLNRVNESARSVLYATALARFLCLFLTLATAISAQSGEPKHVLILMEEDNSWPAFRLINENAIAALRPGLPEGSLIFSEHLDRIHFPDPAFQAQEASRIQQKYAHSAIDLVIGVGDVPTGLFPGVPFLFVRTDPTQKPSTQPPYTKDLVNLWIELDARKTVDVARQLQPNARQLIIIGSTSPTGKNFLAQVRQQISGDLDGLSVVYLANNSFDDVCQKLSTLTPESIVLFVSLSRDGAGRPFISAEAASKLASVSGAPVYGLLDTHIGSGAIGGYTVRFAEMGKRAGQMGLQMLSGERPPDELAPTGYLFDWRQLRRWKIPEVALPAGTVVLFRQPTLWESYKYYILAAILLSFLEALLILGLLWQRSNRKKFEQSLLERVAFEKLLSDLSATFINLPEEHVSASIENNLGRLAAFLKLDRITLYGYSKESKDLMLTFSWRGQGLQNPPAVLRMDQLPWWTAVLLRGETLLLPDLDALPAEANIEKEYLKSMGVVSLASIPLKAGDVLFGGISFVTTNRRVAWTEPLVERLRLLAEIFSNALARERALDARFRHAAIVESSDDAIVSKDLDGIIVSWNAAAQRLYGYSGAEAVGHSITMLIPEERRDEEEEFLHRLKAGGRVEHHETVHIAKGGKRVVVSLAMSSIKDSTGKVVGYSKISRDISDRKRAEQLLRESEERFRLVANSAPVLIWMSGTDKRCTFFNQGWLNFTGCSIEDELGEGWVSSVHPEDARRRVAMYSASFDARVDFEIEYRLRRFDGEYRWMVDYGVPRFESDGNFCGYIGSCVDITERKSASESLQALTGRLIHVQEEERARIARDLHDDFTQRLALQCIDIEQLRRKLPDLEPDEQARLSKMLKCAKAMSSDIRSLSHELHSSRLEFIGLVPALSGLCKEIGEKYKIAVQFGERELPVDMPKDVALCLFRVAQEALGNVVKHSEAESAHVELGTNASGISLRITDRGKGFDRDGGKPRTGIGLVGMTERLRLVNGRLSIKSELLLGTEILAEVPLPAVANGHEAKALTAGGVEP